MFWASGNGPARTWRGARGFPPCRRQITPLPVVLASGIYSLISQGVARFVSRSRLPAGCHSIYVVSSCFRCWYVASVIATRRPESGVNRKSPALIQSDAIDPQRSLGWSLRALPKLLKQSCQGLVIRSDDRQPLRVAERGPFVPRETAERDEGLQNFAIARMELQRFF